MKDLTINELNSISGGSYTYGPHVFSPPSTSEYLLLQVPYCNAGVYLNCGSGCSQCSVGSHSGYDDYIFCSGGVNGMVMTSGKANFTLYSCPMGFGTNDQS